MAAGALALVLLASQAIAQRVGLASSGDPAANVPVTPVAGIHKIRHVIVIMQENHSFDSYFGTYPGADGIPMRDGRPVVCVPDPQLGRCVAPFHDPRGVTGHGGLRNGARDSLVDIAGGDMNGFLLRDPHCTGCLARRPYAMGYKNASDIPLYWALARRYVLQDHLFASSLAWSLPAHLFMVSGWSAACRTANPWSCRSYQGYPAQRGPFAWTDITYLLARHHVSWGYYVDRGWSPDCPGIRCRASSPFAATTSWETSDRPPGFSRRRPRAACRPCRG